MPKTFYTERDIEDLARRGVISLVEDDDVVFLRQLARRTWLFFETFVGPADHWLPPDNYQEDPHGVISHRTSPTNIGMMFLSNLTAWDFGYLGPTEFTSRVIASMDSLITLLRWYQRTCGPTLSTATTIFYMLKKAHLYGQAVHTRLPVVQLHLLVAQG